MSLMSLGPTLCQKIVGCHVICHLKITQKDHKNIFYGFIKSFINYFSLSKFPKNIKKIFKNQKYFVKINVKHFETMIICIHKYLCVNRYMLR